MTPAPSPGKVGDLEFMLMTGLYTLAKNVVGFPLSFASLLLLSPPVDEGEDQICLCHQRLFVTSWSPQPVRTQRGLIKIHVGLVEAQTEPQQEQWL